MSTFKPLLRTAAVGLLVACTSDPDEPASDGMSPAHSAGYMLEVFLTGVTVTFALGLVWWSRRRSGRAQK